MSLKNGWAFTCSNSTFQLVPYAQDLSFAKFTVGRTRKGCTSPAPVAPNLCTGFSISNLIWCEWVKMTFAAWRPNMRLWLLICKTLYVVFEFWLTCQSNHALQNSVPPVHEAKVFLDSLCCRILSAANRYCYWLINITSDRRNIREALSVHVIQEKLMVYLCQKKNLPLFSFQKKIINSTISVN
jgi:hypothetical protein